jgi:DNA segregation ATPase FtsK/SpoIIIE-like protein
MITIDDVDTARSLVREKASPSFLQRKMLISYTDAAILMDILEEEGTVSARNAAGLRKYLLPVTSGVRNCK